MTTGWDVLAAVGLLFFWTCVIAFGWTALWIIVTHIYDLIRGRIIKRYQASKIWQEGYDAGVNDERKAAEWDVPEYRIPRRENPYGTPARFEGDRHAH